MKKILFALTIALTLVTLPLTALADKTKWVNPNYNFRTLHTIELTSVSVVEPFSDNFTLDELATEKIISALQTSIEKRDLTFIGDVDSNLTITRDEDKEQTKEIMKNTFNNDKIALVGNGIAELKVVAHKFGYQSRIIPAHQEPRTYYRKEKIKDNHGNRIEKEVPYTEYAYVPEQTALDAELDVTYNLYDPVSGKIILSIRDVRERTSDSDTTDMWKRMANYFAQELSKLSRK